jgi:hypothetical protein
MLHRFSEFSLEKLFESLILESKLEFSDKFKQVLSFIPKDNEIRNTLLSMRGAADINLVQNYIDISDNKEEVTFIQDRRAQQLIRDNPSVWKTNSSLPGSKFLTFNKNDEGEYKNKKIFDALGFEPMEPISENHPVPGPNVVGKILSEHISTLSGKTYVLFAWNDSGTDKFICLNKDAVDSHSDTEKMLYSSGRNPIRIGRLVNSIMTAAKQPITPKQVEEFTNAYKSAWDMMNDAFSKFDVVSGYTIARWYDESSYESDDSTLGSSCMRYDTCSEYFGIYADNSDVCKLVILYSDKGASMKDGKFTSNYIKGRALLWKTNQGDMFMDRIYTNNDSDVELFKQFAEKNGWWCKKTQNSSNHFTAQKGTSFKDPTYSVDLKWADHEYYPYVDTFSYLSMNELDSRDSSGIISNDPDLINPQYELRDTEGDRDSY